MGLLDFLDRLRRLPIDERRSAANTLTALIMIGVILLWLASFWVSPSAAPEPSEVESSLQAPY